MNSVKEAIESYSELSAVIIELERKSQLTFEDQQRLDSSQDLLDTLLAEMIESQIALRRFYKETRIKTFDTANTECIEYVIGLNMNVLTWAPFYHGRNEEVIPSPEFDKTFIDKVSSLNRDINRQFALGVIDIFISEICMLPEFQGKLSQVYSTQLSVKSRNNKPHTLSGVIDLSVGYLSTPLQLNFMVADNMDDSDLWKCIAGTAALFKLLSDVVHYGDCYTWGVLTNGSEWRFISIARERRETSDPYDKEEYAEVKCSETFTLDLTVYNQEQVDLIYSTLYSFVRSSYHESVNYERTDGLY